MDGLFSCFPNFSSYLDYRVLQLSNNDTRQVSNNIIRVFDHFLELALKGLTSNASNPMDTQAKLNVHMTFVWHLVLTAS